MKTFKKVISIFAVTMVLLSAFVVPIFAQVDNYLGFDWTGYTKPHDTKLQTMLNYEYQYYNLALIDAYNNGYKITVLFGSNTQPNIWIPETQGSSIDPIMLSIPNGGHYLLNDGTVSIASGTMLTIDGASVTSVHKPRTLDIQSIGGSQEYITTISNIGDYYDIINTDETEALLYGITSDLVSTVMIQHNGNLYTGLFQQQGSQQISDVEYTNQVQPVKFTRVTLTGGAPIHIKIYDGTYAPWDPGDVEGAYVQFISPYNYSTSIKQIRPVEIEVRIPRLHWTGAMPRVLVDGQNNNWTFVGQTDIGSTLETVRLKLKYNIIMPELLALDSKSVKVDFTLTTPFKTYTAQPWTLIRHKFVDSGDGTDIISGEDEQDGQDSSIPLSPITGLPLPETDSFLSMVTGAFTEISSFMTGMTYVTGAIFASMPPVFMAALTVIIGLSVFIAALRIIRG